MNDAPFDPFIRKLQQNVYQSAKGRIRLHLLKKDICEFFPAFTSRTLSILDVGCGAGQFAALCVEAGHSVCLLDESEQMIIESRSTLGRHITSDVVTFRTENFQNTTFSVNQLFDLVLLHGSAEWMPDTEQAIHKAINLLSPGGCLSLLMYNPDTHLFKKGINGHLPGPAPRKKRKLFPPGALSTTDTAAILTTHPGTLLVQSGIRIFQGFFRQISPAEQPFEHWLNQEIQYYRTPPFCLLGQHSHFLWQKETPLTNTRTRLS